MSFFKVNIIKIQGHGVVALADSSYELGIRCSLARWIRMDEGYNTMALDLDYLDFQNRLLKWLSLGACSSSILSPFGSYPCALFINLHHTYTHTKDKEKE